MLRFKKVNDQKIIKETANLLSKGYIIGWFQGRMETGPRALGNRSILMDPRKLKNKDIINSRVKYREAFRPFCPSMLDSAIKEYMVNVPEIPFMNVSGDVRKNKINDIPAVTHVDGTARPQSVSKKTNPRFYKLIQEFGKITGVPVLLNTSFNIKGEPVVCSPEDAVKCFFDTGIDYLVIGNYIVNK